MVDNLTKDQRSRVMSRNRSKGTRPELYMNTLAETAGLSFEKHDGSLPGKPDMVFTAAHLAVFIDGDFWHGWRFPIWEHRLSDYWREKISANRTRDQRNFRRLRQLGWKVLRIWEHQIETDVVECVIKVADASNKRINRSIVEDKYTTMPPLRRRKRLPKP